MSNKANEDDIINIEKEDKNSEYYSINTENLKKTYEVDPISLHQYPDRIKKPTQEQTKNIYHGIKYSLGYMGSGVSMEGDDLSLGANYFLKSGKCNPETSTPVCKDKDKYLYVRNVPTGTIPPLNLSFYGLTGCNLTGLTEGRGLVPGLVEDVYDFNPIEMGIAVSKKGNIGNDECKEMTLPIGSKIYSPNAEGKTWKWETRCTSGFNSMTETTNKNLNNLVKEKNPTINNARLPGPYQLRENFSAENSDDNFINLFLLVIGFSAILAIYHSK
tara:strand:- start:10882 stop:11700 length:819 start_codon:yes stop_codon:yes gene_type:complete